MNCLIESLSEVVKMGPADLHISDADISMILPVAVICVVSLLLTTTCVLAMGVYEALRPRR